jgi:hypothetical protein
MKITTGVLFFITGMLFLVGCKTDTYEKVPSSGREPVIEPDYSGIIIPLNIAPMNFSILERGKYYRINAKS